jgi:flagellar hook-associated protein 1 FlgK
MSDLLGIGSAGVSAYRTALAAIANNVAKADTPGYARREAVLSERAVAGSRSPLYREYSLFGGVEAIGVRRSWDSFRAADARFAASASGRADSRAQWLESVEGVLGDGPTGIGSLLGTFFNSAVSAASAPNDRLSRTNVLMTLDDAAGAFRTTADGLARVSVSLGNAAELEASALNADLAALVEINAALRQSAPGQASRASLEDDRDRLIDSVAERIDVNASIADNGVATLTLAGAGGVTLLEPNDRALAVVAKAADGRLSLQLLANGTTTPLPANGGRLAGLIDVAASNADRRAELESLAADFVADLNAWSAQGRDLAGNPGGPMLEMTAGAVSMRVVMTDPDAIAAASATGIENGNLLALNALRGDGGAEARWAALVAGNAQALSAARAEAAAASNRRDNSLAARDEITGIDLDREAAELLRYQQAYNGSAKVIQIARETMQTILEIL